MRVSLKVDSVSTEDLRDMMAAANSLPDRLTNRPVVWLNGPECWAAEFPPVSPMDASVILGAIRWDTR